MAACQERMQNPECGIRMKEFPFDGRQGSRDGLFSTEQAAAVLAFHETLEGYSQTPLRSLEGLAGQLGISGIYMKDESCRFGLNAFKGLGGSYALGRLVAGVAPGTRTFVTATDGNHGRGIAWAARNLKQKAVVYMPAGSSEERLNAIRALGAEAQITEYNYDDTVRFAAKQAQRNGWTLVQDTAWPGYEEIPSYIMQGYMTMAAEAVEQLNGLLPTHIFLQAGVGAMAGALTGFFSHYYSGRMPTIVIAEPDRADCLFQTAAANDGKLHKVEGALDSIMAGLCCGEVCTIGWEILKHHAKYFFSCPDYVAADGMRVLGNPVKNDPRVISGESGALTCGLIYHLMTDECLAGIKRIIGLDGHSRILCFSTEGATDQTAYRHIVWDGWYAADHQETKDAFGGNI